MKLMSFFNFFFNPVTWVKLTTFSVDFGDNAPAAPTQTTVTNTNIPDYAQGYVENMLGATQQQLFNVGPDGTISGIKPYQPYSTNMNDYVAGFSPMQQNAQRGASQLTLPGQFGQGSQFANAAGLGSLGTASQAAGAGNNYYQMATDPNAVNAFMNPYMQNALNPQLDEIRRQYDISGQQQKGAATGAGAFGGSREALMEAENTRNMGTTMNQAIGNAYNNAFQQAQNAQQFGANLGLQGQQTALQGYGQAGQAGALLGQLGQQQLAGQQGIIGTQNQIGAQQQALEQAKMNQDIQNYATAQQYPLMELGMMSNMLRGLPMSAPTTSMYQAQPTSLTQAIGTAGAIGSLGKSGTVPGTKAGGILSVKNYDIGGAVKADLERLPTEKLQEMLTTAESSIEKQQIKSILAERQQGAIPELAPGGIVAFEEGGGIWDALKKIAKGAVGDEEAQNAIIKDSGGVPPAPEVEKERPAYANRFASMNPAKEGISPGIGGNQSTMRLGPDNNAYMTPSADLEVPSAGKAPPIPERKADNAAPGVKLNQIPAIPSVTREKEIPFDPDQELGGIKPSNLVTEANAAKTDFLKDMDSIMKDPLQAPYAKEQYNYFQSKIDNAKAKEDQMFWLHSATFFAKMATQPGGVMKAAMTSLAEQIPLYAKDKEEQEKLLDSYHKAQYDLTNAEIARRSGDEKAAKELQMKALDVSRGIYSTLGTNQLESKKATETRAHNIAEERIDQENAAAHATMAGAEVKKADAMEDANKNIKADALHTQQVAKVDTAMKPLREDLTLNTLLAAEQSGKITPTQQQTLNGKKKAYNEAEKNAFQRYLPKTWQDDYVPRFNMDGAGTGPVDTNNPLLN